MSEPIRNTFDIKSIRMIEMDKHSSEFISLIDLISELLCCPEMTAKEILDELERKNLYEVIK
ncbi:MAG: hypothetical protein MK132_20230 [Lentisphaerales bacterium]|nr:hypothetical protein [Lentisphaerales bacterium]